VLVFYRHLMRIDRVRSWLEKRAAPDKHRRSLDRYGPLFVVLMTPLVGVWIIAAMAKAAGMNDGKLLVSSLVSIVVYAVAIAALIALGVDIAG
jgi:hypothetical protein